MGDSTCNTGGQVGRWALPRWEDAIQGAFQEESALSWGNPCRVCMPRSSEAVAVKPLKFLACYRCGGRLGSLGTRAFWRQGVPWQLQTVTGVRERDRRPWEPRNSPYSAILPSVEGKEVDSERRVSRSTLEPEAQRRQGSGARSHSPLKQDKGPGNREKWTGASPARGCDARIAGCCPSFISRQGCERQERTPACPDHSWPISRPSTPLLGWEVLQGIKPTKTHGAPLGP